jgi:hypothetical protein
MGIKYEVVANGGTYTNKAGEEKKRWVKVGVVMENDRGMSLKMESIPVNWDGWAILSEPREKPQSDDSSVPF